METTGVQLTISNSALLIYIIGLAIMIMNVVFYVLFIEIDKVTEITLSDVVFVICLCIFWPIAFTMIIVILPCMFLMYRKKNK